MIGGFLGKLFGRRTQQAGAVDRFARQPWLYQKHATKSEREQQLRYQSELSALGECSFGQNVYVSPGATIDPRRVVIGDNSAVGVEAQIGFDVEIGRDCTVNAGAVIRGLVRIGDDVRIASGAQVLGFNHGWDDLEKPIWLQPISRKGITIGDDVWIGANAVVLDGISIGSHAVIGAGAIVTRNVPSWTIAVGNPARVVRSRKYGSLSSADDSLRRNWDNFVKRVVSEMPCVLARRWHDPNFVDRPNDLPKTRAWTDAVELASMSGCALPGISTADLIESLRSFQDPVTGLVPGPYREAKFDPDSVEAANLETANAAYMVMALGYALECLGSNLGYPVTVAQNLETEQLTAKLTSLPWEKNAWQAGAWVDHFATACFFNQRHHALTRNMDDLRGWLLSNVDPSSGMWGKPRSPGDWLQPVNGFYRLTRGAHAQFGWDLEHPDKVIDTVLAHAHDVRYFGPQKPTACYILDIIHPLLMARRQTSYRRGEIGAVARYWLNATINHWQHNEGMSFEMCAGAVARLQGTQMWLSIAWLCAYALGFTSEDDDFSPKGIHRLNRLGEAPSIPTHTGAKCLS